MFKLEELKRLAGERTKGKWLPMTQEVENSYVAIAPFYNKLNQAKLDAKFIAYCGTHADAIVQALETQKERIEDLEELVAVYKNLCDLDENKKLHKRIEKLEAALKQYSNLGAFGQTARKALAEVPDNKERRE